MRLHQRSPREASGTTDCCFNRGHTS